MSKPLSSSALYPENHPLVSRDASVGITHADPFSASLWAFTAKQHMAPRRRLDTKRALMKYHGGELPMPDVAPAKSLAREIKMLSLNPSVYGNKYGVLGSS